MAITSKKGKIVPMSIGYSVKIQKVERPGTSSYYVNFPVALAESLGITKGESFVWLVEDKNTLVFERERPAPKRKMKKTKKS